MGTSLQIAYSDRFLQNFARLDRDSQMVVREVVKLLAQNSKHPSLWTKKIQGTRGIYEASANMDLRMTWQYQGEGIILMRNCRHHDRTLKHP
jgi:mRNA-degrading endonuclease YafQ of YafQ-DinJ toxin-antitoxin module